jgi:hypothetical protein
MLENFKKNFNSLPESLFYIWMTCFIIILFGAFFLVLFLMMLYPLSFSIIPVTLVLMTLYMVFKKEKGK